MPQAGLAGGVARAEASAAFQEPKATAGSSAKAEQGQSSNGVARVGSFSSRRSTTAETHPGMRDITTVKEDPFGTREKDGSLAPTAVEKVQTMESNEERSDSDSSSSLSAFGNQTTTRSELAIKPQAIMPEEPKINIIGTESCGCPRQSWISRAIPGSMRSLRNSLESWLVMPHDAAEASRNSEKSSRSSGQSDKFPRRPSTKSDMMQSEHSQLWHEVHQTIWDCITSDGNLQDRLSVCRRMFRRRWRDFRFFGVNRNDKTPRVWGQRIISERKANDRQMLSNMVANHHHHNEMRLQLRDESVRLQYLDAFRTDCEPRGWMIRVFSPGASLMEYFKLIISVWTFLFSLTIVAFWKVLQPIDQEVLIVDLIIDLLYAFLLVLQLRTTILRVDIGKELCGTRKIFHHHFFDWRFWIDIASCVPVMLLFEFTGKGADASAYVWVVLVKALRGWRIGRLPPKHRFIPSMRFLLIRVSLGMLMGGHLLACIWFTLVYEMEKTVSHHIKSPDEKWQECTSTTEPPRGCLWRLYSMSINQGIYLLMGIDRDAFSALEHFFLTICMPLGALVHAYVLGEIILLLQRRGALETRQNEHTLAIQEAMRILGLSPSLQVRIITFFTFERLNRCGGLFHELFTDLSPQLRFELQLQLYLDLVVQSGLFKNMRPRVIREIVVHLKDLIFLPGDWICRFGDYGDSMYFIVTGSCKILAKDATTELRELTHGCYFGEVALLTGVPRTAYVLASTFCIVAHLTKEVFEPIVRKWPEEMDNLLRGVEKETDRMKIKEEAARYYCLPSAPSRRTSTAGIRRDSNTNTFGRRMSENFRGSQRVSCRSSGSFVIENEPKVHNNVGAPLAEAGDDLHGRSSVRSLTGGRRVSAPEVTGQLSRLASFCSNAGDVSSLAEPASEPQAGAATAARPNPRRRISRSNTLPATSSTAPPGQLAMMLQMQPSIASGLGGLPNGALTRQVMQTAMEQISGQQLEASDGAVTKTGSLGGKPFARAASFSDLQQVKLSKPSKPSEDSKTQEQLDRERREHEALVKERDAEVEGLTEEMQDLLRACSKLEDDLDDQKKFLAASLNNLKKSVTDTVREAVAVEVAKIDAVENLSEGGTSSGMLEAMVI